MKAISLWQPWASLWCSPAKPDETRHWVTSHRGPLLVHAAQKIITDVEPALDAICVKQFGRWWRRELPRGMIVGVVNLLGIFPTDEIIADHQHNDGGPLDAWDNYHCGDFSPGRFGWRRGRYLRLERPFLCRGHQRTFDVPDELLPDAVLRFALGDA